jgi:GNAT superfamily N-acetyltransferase
MADITQRYGAGDGNPVRPTEFDPPEGGFLVAWRGGEPVACAGWRRLAAEAFGERVAEIKRMYVVPAERGTGVAAAVLAAVEDSAKGHGMRGLVLETGLKQPEAIRFYAKCGYERVTNYGHYRDYPDCVSFGRSLDAPAPPAPAPPVAPGP